MLKFGAGISVWVITSVLVVDLRPAKATILYDEGVDGDLSGNRAAPTALTLSLGTNSVIATSDIDDREYVTLSVPEGMQLDAIILASYVSLDDTAFIAVQQGTTFTEPPGSANVANLLGYAHFGPGPGNVGTDVLDDMGLGAGAIGFIPPLVSDDYTYWMQEHSENAATYQFDFIVSAVPSPCDLPGDLNEDTLVNAEDIREFVSCLLTGTPLDGNCACGDFVDSDGVRMADIPAFLAALGV
jgi:hypothetical protein